MDIPTIPGAVYSVVAPSACTITDKATGRVLATTAPNEQKDFRAFGSVTTLSDPDAIYVAATTFSAAPTIGSGGGGGVTIQFDSTPTQNSTNAVTSGGLYNLLFGLGLKLGRGGGAVRDFSVAIGFGSGASGNGAVSVGNQVANTASNAVAIGSDNGTYGVTGATGNNSVALGVGARSSSNCALAVGAGARANQPNSVALGRFAEINEDGAFALATWESTNTTKTTLYVIGAGSTLANEYENGEACLGYVVKDSSGNISACGTRKLSELLTNNTAFTPALLDLEADPPKVFLPAGSTDPLTSREEELIETEEI